MTMAVPFSHFTSKARGSMMLESMTKAVDRANLTEDFLVQEREKSNLILEATLLKQQGLFEEASMRYARAAEIEESLALQSSHHGKTDKAFFHQFSALSCWAQAGDLHRALLLGRQLLQTDTLSSAQREQLYTYLQTLQIRIQEWMSHWVNEKVYA